METTGRFSGWRPRALLALLPALAAACDEAPTAPDRAGSGRLAVVAYDPGPALWIQQVAADAGRRIHFTGAADGIAGNHPGLPVTDETIRAIGPVKWSPDGGRVALVASVAFDQSEVVIVNEDGSGARVASPNTQIILSDIAWSADGTRVAYAMSTLPHTAGVDLFVTDLRTDSVVRVTEGYAPSVAGGELAFDATGRVLFASKMTGAGRARLDRIDLTTGVITPVATELDGEPQGIAQGGAWMLLLRRVNGERVLVRHTLATGAELELARAPALQFAELDASGEHALVAIGDDRSEHRIVRTSGGQPERIEVNRRGSFAVDLFR